MMMYLLLRDNKQSGPYSLDELKAKGLKAYDLVWVDGKSAAWRYPSELEELKAFAPVVEEQPFDRFFKKPAGESSASLSSFSSVSAVSSVSSSSAAITNQAGPAPVLAIQTTPLQKALSTDDHAPGEPSTVPGKRIIYVTMPAGKNQAGPREFVSRETPKPQAAIPMERVLDRTGQGKGQVPGNAAAGAGEKHSQSNENGRNAVEINARSSKEKNASRYLQPIAVAFCIVALLAAGIFIGLSINRTSLHSAQPLVAGNTVTPSLAPSPVVQRLPVINTSAAMVPPSPSPNRDADITNMKSAVGAENSQTGRPAGKSLKMAGPKDKEKTKIPASANQVIPSAPLGKDSSSALSAASVIPREASHRGDIPVDKTAKTDKDISLTNSISNLVSVGSNNYSVGTFGGISGLQLTVSNHSPSPLDLVVVEVQYIQANKKVFKTETLYFHSITAGSASILEAPQSPRGIKVQCKITQVNSKELGLSYSAL
jgi:hypothetical protein